MSDLATIRRELAQARSDLRTADDYLHSARLRAELALIDRVGGDPKHIGSNDTDRKRAYDIACEGNDDYRWGLENLRKLQADVARLEAELDIQLDARRAREWELRERNIAVLEAWQTSDPKLDDPIGEVLTP